MTVKTLCLLVCMILGAIMSPLQIDAIFIKPEPFTCSSEFCTQACSRFLCGNYRCPEGYCVVNKKIQPTPICLCNPRPDHPASLEN
ncbi:hypothetical protein F511_10457 [Dorcoceras hygrometricum]|uniref:Uncharacterized protein n=1 Tax=Dorcoceras hygrometricum TaxID=472368 RepID=A0A2Z7D171_9LAMI|nr:hypothetical protein F511_10457 [Dorcoceras hygrometricum]